MNTTSWECPYCGRPTTVTLSDMDSFESELTPVNFEGMYQIFGRYIVCPNPECKRPTLTVNIKKGKKQSNGFYNYADKPVYTWNLLPKSLAKQFPDYIPAAVISDYSEACEIELLSPKAAATLARRALQGMIIDYWKIDPTIITKKGKKVFKSLASEIDEIEGKIEPSLRDAITGIRELGNIGAHMEEDIDRIIEIDTNEVRILITLIETLIREWYIAKHDREERIKAVSKIAEIKRISKGVIVQVTK